MLHTYYLLLHACTGQTAFDTILLLQSYSIFAIYMGIVHNRKLCAVMSYELRVLKTTGSLFFRDAK